MRMDLTNIMTHMEGDWKKAREHVHWPLEGRKGGEEGNGKDSAQLQGSGTEWEQHRVMMALETWSRLKKVLSGRFEQVNFAPEGLNSHRQIHQQTDRHARHCWTQLWTVRKKRLFLAIFGKFKVVATITGKMTVLFTLVVKVK